MSEDLNNSRDDYFLTDEERIELKKSKIMQQVHEFQNEQQQLVDDIQKMEGLKLQMQYQQEQKLEEIKQLRQQYEQQNQSHNLPEREKQKYIFVVEEKQELLKKIIIKNETFRVLLEEQGEIENLDQQIFNKKIEKSELTQKLKNLRKSDNMTISEKQNIQVLKLEDHQNLIKDIHNKKIILLEQKRKNDILESDLTSIISSLNQFKYAIEQQQSKISTFTQIKQDLLKQITQAKVEQPKESSKVFRFFTEILRALFS